MITIFSIPARHEGHTGVIQYNAISSWTKLPGCEVILFEEHPEELSQEIRDKVRVADDLRKNEFGTPLVSEAFSLVKKLATNDIVMYANSDIIFSQDVLHAVELVGNSNAKSFLVVGQRTDVDISDRLEFDEEWESHCRELAHMTGKLHGKAGMDYFIFNRHKFLDLPEFPVGRPGWDSWLLYSARANGIPVIDATSQILAIHQNHPPRYRYTDPESLKNREIAGGLRNLATIRDANFVLTRFGVERPSLVQRMLKSFMFSWMGRNLLAAKRAMQHLLIKQR